MIVLVPAYEPDERLVDLVRSLRTADADLGVLVVDDGSGPTYAAVFDAARALGATVLTQPANVGKGHVLKVGFAHIERHHPGADVVCADCDGQHSVVDILRVATRVRESEAAMVLGARQFSGRVPARSRLGNAVTRRMFSLATGRVLHDTQTGLRGYPAAVLGWLQTVPGERFEYELNLLLEATATRREIEEVAIATIYLDGNSSSHFRPVADSVRIYAPLLKFVGSSLGAFAVDTVALLALQALTGSLLVSVLGARVVSSAVNFAVNRSLVFDRGRSRHLRVAALRYYALTLVLLTANVTSLWALTTVGVPLLAAKVATEAVLFVASYRVQRTVVFGAPPDDALPPPAASRPGEPQQAGAQTTDAHTTASQGTHKRRRSHA